MQAIASGLKANETLEKLAFTDAVGGYQASLEYCLAMIELHDAVKLHPKLTVLNFEFARGFGCDQEVAMAALEANRKMQEILQERRVPHVANVLALLADFSRNKKIFMPNEILQLLARHWLNVDSFALVTSEHV